ncbi:probable myosin light chain kinase DDB_G0284661 [Sitodiplosis mosellana]|uniref:probable myosin light chain kinase DDB_G0284661 n=1 Tax=Sitodiplosis mosellana TaxID=263140 RepID=UPI002443DA1C|nr:probable myosin light chain kinase DDB_G0284661 [Sitodiplosis mosellana]XP_055311395.1 probable myosin light chain kinase DDB_G0284661 [Sitodiplosis mosellana]
MNSSSLRKQHGNIHRIREFELEKVNLSDEFDILQIVGEGWFGKILLVEHRATDTEMVLKALPKPYVSLRDFYREFHYGLHLGAHKNIVTTYDVAFETAGFYVFTQEYAPLGDLTSNVSDSGIGETPTKKVAKQIASALDYIHSKDLVHRDVKLDNVLVCRSDFSRVKLCDFGETRKAYSYVQRRNEWLPYSPPEVLTISTDQTYQTVPSHDLWQFGIVLFVCLTGCLPWQKAASEDPRYMRYLVWQSSSMVIPIKRTPKLFKLLTNKACKLFRKYLEPIPERRPKNLSDLHKFLGERWLAKNAEKDMIANEPDELCASMYSFHSSPEEKNKLLYALTQHGIETTVDRVAKKKRIRDWIQESVIQEDDEEDEEGDEEEIRHTQRAPVAGHVSSVRAQEKAARTQIVSTVKDASNKHINPRTGKVQIGSSEMGHQSHNDNNGNPHERIGYTNQMENLTSNVELRRENNGYDYQATRRSTKLVDVGSQTSSESQKQLEMANSIRTYTPERPISIGDVYTTKNSQSVPTISHTPGPYSNSRSQNTQTNLSRMDTTSRGFMSAFNSLATVAVPAVKIQQTQQSSVQHLQPFSSRNRERSQPRQSYQQRHNTTVLTKQPISRSVHNFNSLVNDSGYGSLDKLRSPTSNDAKNLMTSPTLSKRSIVQSKLVTPSNGGTVSSNEFIHINGLSHSQNESGRPFDSDSGGDGECSPRGSNGFVNYVGAKTPLTETNNLRMSMKDTAYDQATNYDPVRSSRKKR